MIRPDLIVTWPKNCDYPLWRQFIHDNREKFDRVLIAIMEPGCGYNFMPFLIDAMTPDNVTFLGPLLPQRPEDDWRNLAINAALLQSKADWVWFTEQDFYVKDGFWEEVERLEKAGCDAIVTYDGADRMHPCCLFIKKEVLNRTNKNFGIVPNKHDHFWLFAKEVESMGVRIGILEPSLFHHLQGLSHNWILSCGGAIPNFNPDDFCDWLKQSIAVTVPQSPFFNHTANAVIAKIECGKQ